MSTDRLLGDSSFEHDEKVCFEPDPESFDGRTQYLVFFITGNPGLTSYYRPFLSRLHKLLSTASNPESGSFHICGHSFKGMEFGQNGTHPTPLGLEDQIQDQEDHLYHDVNSYRERNGKSPKVILIGHSVGSYMLLEIIKRHHDRITCGEKDFDLIGGILLFPTITYIAQSPLGRGARILLGIPHLPTIMGFLARSFAQMLPSDVFYRLVKFVTKFPEHAATTTANFIKSPMGVQQVLHLARDEMHFITNDKWDQEVWGAATAEGTDHRDTANWNLTLYWGKKDRWVANNTRDALIAARGHRSPIQAGPGAGDCKPVMVIDDDGIPHDFCTTIRNSDIIADKVKSWIDGIIRSHRIATS